MIQFLRRGRCCKVYFFVVGPSKMVVVLFKTSHFPGVSGGFLERFGLLERMGMEGSPRGVSLSFEAGLFRLLRIPLRR